jgi:hypothetical protein
LPRFGQRTENTILFKKKSGSLFSEIGDDHFFRISIFPPEGKLMPPIKKRKKQQGLNISGKQWTKERRD